MKIEDFKSKFDDFLRPNLYKVEFDLPPLMQSWMQGSETVAMFCKACSYPFSTIGKQESIYNGCNRTIAAQVDLDPIDLTFMVDSSPNVLRFFQDWFNIIETDYKYGFPKDYICQLKIHLLDRAHNIISTATLVDAYPTNRQAIALAYDSNDAIQELQVSFVYYTLLHDVKNPPKANIGANSKNKSIGNSQPAENSSTNPFAGAKASSS